MTVFLIALRFDTQLLQEPFFISAHEFSECPHRLSRFVFKELFVFRCAQRTMCILGFLFFSSTVFFNFFQIFSFLGKKSLMNTYPYIYMEFLLKFCSCDILFAIFALLRDVFIPHKFFF